ncbi:hypothetical protein GCM10023149_07290 [Mucilaginibacter gynuensis]|uniref:DUF1080 domain-containing protein n=1 Tax=Mucilaginibacter gynuensis TaxID=1302236 RepID=A0ABP8FVX8_9SPHI
MPASNSIKFFLTFSLFVSCTAFAQKSKSVYSFNKAPLTPGSYVELPLGSIKAKGWLLKQLELQRDGATGHAEELYAENENLGAGSDWLGGKGSGWERVPYYVKGLVALAYTLDDAALKTKAEKWINWTLDHQQANGCFGPEGMTDWWPRMPMMYAIRDYYEATGDKRVIGFFTRYFKYELQNLPAKPLSEWSRSRTGDNIEIVTWLYNKTGDKSLLQLADVLVKQAYPWTDIYTNNQFFYLGDDFHTKHMVSVGQALKFPALKYELTGSAYDKEAMRKGIEHLMRDHGQPAGIGSGTEFLAGKSSAQGTETCTVVEWMQSLETAARVLHDATIGDRLEKIAFNNLPAQFSRDIKEHLYYTMPNQVFCKYGDLSFNQDYIGGILLSPYSGMGCCRYNMHMGWPYFVKNSWAATPDGGLAIIAYAPVVVNATVAGNTKVNITEETDYPFNDKITLRIKLAKGAAFPLKLRIPGWCKNASVTVNGAKVSGIKTGEIFSLNRQWKDKDEVVLHFPMELSSSAQVNNSVSIERGPLVYALKLDAEYFSRQEHAVKGFHDYEVFPKSAWNYGLLLDTANIKNSVKVETAAMPENPFDAQKQPVTLKVKAQKLPNWTVAYNGMYSFDVPYGPLLSDQKTEEVSLVPYGTENIRISCFPQIGKPAPAKQSYSANFDKGEMLGWVYYGGGWYVRDGALVSGSNAGSGDGAQGPKIVVPGASFKNFVYEADVAVTSKGNAGLIFRVSNPAPGANNFQGYYIGINAGANRVEAGKVANQRYTPIASAGKNIAADKWCHIRVEARGGEFKVFAGEDNTPVVTFRDAEFNNGAIGFRAYNTIAKMDNVKVEALPD